MIDQMNLSLYLISWGKRVFDLITAVILLVLLLPIMVVIFFIVVVTEGWPGIFVQNRVAKDGKIFRMYKFRSMRVGAEAEQEKYKKLNEVDGPVFKIRNDPRFIGVGKWLSHTGLDELPQLLNVIKGDMSMVGPRPLPVNEARMLDQKYRFRKLINPGIMSEWQVKGSHWMKFEDWMELDLSYFKNASMLTDVKILTKTVNLVVKWVIFR